LITSSGSTLTVWPDTALRPAALHAIVLRADLPTATCFSAGPDILAAQAAGDTHADEMDAAFAAAEAAGLSRDDRAIAPEPRNASPETAANETGPSPRVALYGFSAERAAELRTAMAVHGMTAFPVADAVVDGGVCHGAAGLGLVFHRLAQGSDDPAPFIAARDRWLRRLLAMRAGSDPGLLTGTAGMALVIAAALGTDDGWDAPLGTDLLPRATP
jgi:hypothetical protein